MEADSAVERAKKFGIDMTIVLDNIKLSPAGRIEKLERWLEFLPELNGARRITAGSDAKDKNNHVHCKLG